MKPSDIEHLAAAATVAAWMEDDNIICEEAFQIDMDGQHAVDIALDIGKELWTFAKERAEFYLRCEEIARCILDEKPVPQDLYSWAEYRPSAYQCIHDMLDGSKAALDSLNDLLGRS